MKTLILMRHAKSSWKDTKLKDHERSLNKRGKKNAPMMGKLLKEMELTPQVMISSSAVRAMETAEAVAKACGYKKEIKEMDSLYLAEPETYISVLKEIPNDIERVMVIGHNPGIEGLLQILSKEILCMPTASIAHIYLPINAWNELDKKCHGELVNLWMPRDLEKSKEKK